MLNYTLFYIVCYKLRGNRTITIMGMSSNFYLGSSDIAYHCNKSRSPSPETRSPNTIKRQREEYEEAEKQRCMQSAANQLAWNAIFADCRKFVEEEHMVPRKYANELILAHNKIFWNHHHGGSPEELDFILKRQKIRGRYYVCKNCVDFLFQQLAVCEHARHFLLKEV